MVNTQIIYKQKKLKGIPKGLSAIYKGYIPMDWNQDVLSNKASVEYGISSPLNRSLENGTHIIAMPNVNVHGEFVLDDLPFIENEKVKAKNILQKGDLLFNWRNGSEKHIGKTAFYNLEGTHTHVGFLLRIRTRSGIDSFFLYNYINFIRAKKYFTKAKVQVNNSFNKEELLDLPLIFPPLPEQQKIAQILSTWDKGITKTEQLIKQKEKLKQGLMQQLLTGKKRFREFVKSDKVKESKLGWIPEDWEVKSLGEIGEFKNGINKAKEDFGHGVPFVNLMDVFGKPVVNNLDLELVNANSKEVENYSLQNGDVLFVRSSVKPSGVGLTSLINVDIPNTVYSGFLIRFRECSKVLDHNFKKYCFYNREFRNNLIKKSSVSANANINQESLQKLEVAIPYFDEQQKIASVLSSADQEITSLQNQLTKLKEQKKGLMQKLLTGEVRVKIDEI